METYIFTQKEKLEQAKNRVKHIKGFYKHATVYFFVNLFIIASCYIDNPLSLNLSDPYMTAVFWGIGLFAHGFSVFGRDFLFGKNWEQREIQKILNK
ncbi:2TM domain-containing protein [Halpernia sp.]|uniref:2TM domain-containing protein n=1 Tax=Halpernia sp. TaxID=2782209 RepID=UPI003A912727